MERDMEMQVQIQEQEERKREEVKNDDRERQLADIVYIFFDKKESGIMFYDRTYSKEVPEDVFITDIHSIGVADWDERLNEPGKTILCKVVNGTLRVTTIMVSQEKYFEICDKILNQPKDEEKIVIDARELQKLNNNDINFNNKKDINYEDLIKLRNDLISNSLDFNNIDINKNDIIGGFGSNKI